MGDGTAAHDWGERTAADLSGLLVELGRVWKAACYYGGGAAATAHVSDRASRAWRADLARAGPLELEVGDGGFAAQGLAGLFGAEHLAGVARGLEGVGVRHLRFTEMLSPQSLTAFALSLANLEEGERPPSQLGIDVGGVTTETVPQPLPTVPPVANSVAQAPQLEPRPEPQTEPKKPDPGNEDLAAPPSDAGSAQLLQGLRSLDRCAGDQPYIQLAAMVAASTRALSDEGRNQEATRAMLLLADHAVGEGGRSAVQARVARETLIDLAVGERLAELIERACSRDSGAAVRAAQLLLTLGDHAVPALLERLGGEPDSDRAAQLTGVLIALGEATVPALTAAIGAGRGRQARLAIQLAGDLQCPGLVQPLRDLLRAKEGHLHREAARALVEMGNSAALRVLLEALDSRDDRTSEIAALSLGTLGAPRSLPALARRLERASEDRHWNLVREILLAMAQFHEGDRATARVLAAWVQRGGPPWRRPNLDLKLEAVTTLGRLGGPHSTDALREIAGRRLPTRICERAKRILDRRGEGRKQPR